MGKIVEYFPLPSTVHIIPTLWNIARENEASKLVPALFAMFYNSIMWCLQQQVPTLNFCKVTKSKSNSMWYICCLCDAIDQQLEKEYPSPDSELFNSLANHLLLWDNPIWTPSINAFVHNASSVVGVQMASSNVCVIKYPSLTVLSIPTYLSLPVPPFSLYLSL